MFKVRDFSIIAAAHWKNCIAAVDKKYHYWTFNYLHKGAIYFQQAGMERINALPGFFYWTRPGQCYRFGNVKGLDWEHIYVAVEGKRAERWSREGLIPKQKQSWLELEPSDELMSSFKKLVYLNTSTEFAAKESFVLALERLLLDVQILDKSLKEKKGRGHVSMMRELITNIALHPEQSYSFESISESFHMSYRSFRRWFHKMTNMAPQEYLNDKKLELAARLLLSSSEKIKNIAEQCGYESQLYFSSRFKKKYQMSPKEYRAYYGL